jgi:hypothetical protein
MSALRQSFVYALTAFALTFTGCGPTEDTQPMPAALADVAKPERSTPPLQATARKAGVPRVTLASKRDTAPMKAHYPVPIEVQGCLARVAAGDATKATPVCARAHQLAPDNTEVRAALANLATE